LLFLLWPIEKEKKCTAQKEEEDEQNFFYDELKEKKSNKAQARVTHSKAVLLICN
jgi:hypothetical protein